MEEPFDRTWLTERQQRVWRQWLGVQAWLPAELNRQLQNEHGLSLSDFDVLVHLREAPERRARVTALAESLQWEQSRLSHHLARMEKRGLIAREHCAHDGRGFFAVLTDEGEGRLTDAAPSHVDTVRRLLFDHIDDDQLAVVGAVLEGVLEGLRPKNGCQRYPEAVNRADRDGDAASGGSLPREPAGRRNG